MMKLTWKDVVAAILIVAGGVVMFAKLQSYNWAMIGSWKGALGVLSVLGLGILLTNATELARIMDGTTLAETVLWLVVATVAIGGLVVTTTKAEFVTTGVAVGVAWVAQFARHIWVTTHSDNRSMLGAR